MVNFAEHEHAIDPLTYFCRICGRGEFELAEESGWAGYDISAKWAGYDSPERSDA